VTTPVRNSELVEECSISRSQVRICLKRLTGKGLVKRLVDEADIGANAGYRYFVT
jgi:predicted transcriptional regulator